MFTQRADKHTRGMERTSAVGTRYLLWLGRLFRWIEVKR